MNTPKKPTDSSILPTFAICVLDKSFVYVGNIQIIDGFLHITESHNIRVWGTKSGLGELGLNGNLRDTVLDKTPDVFVPMHSVVHFMETDRAKWKL